MHRTFTTRAALLASAAFLAGGLQPARAQSDARINAIQSQIQSLSAELRQVKRDLAARDAAVKGAQTDAANARAQAQQTQDALAHLPAPNGFGPVTASRGPSLGLGYAHPDIPSPKTDFSSLNVSGVSASDQKAGATSQKGTFHIGGVTIQLGGFFAVDGIYRSRNDVTDVASNWNTGIPLRNSVLNHESEVRGSARQSRVAVLLQGDADVNQHISGYAELDLQGAAPTANGNESNSYNPRIRQAYAAYDNDALNVHVLAGQAWSLATLTKVGLVPRQEDLPATIDQQYVPGFTWTRQPQLRIAADFLEHKLWVGASIESPQATYTIGPNGTGSNSGAANFNNLGVSTLNTTNNYSTDVAPDVILKVAADPGYGHYEVFGLGRLFEDRVSVLGSGHNNSRLGGGVGAGVILPIIPAKLDFQLSGLAGYGIGRYGSAQLPDATISPTGASSPLPGYQALAGLIAHPVPTVDLYSYVGTEQVGRRSFNVGTTPYGYGNPNYSNAGCDVELSAATCTGQTSGVVQGTIGAYWRFLQGDFGTLQTGIQYAYTQRTVFKGLTAVGGGGNSGADENTVLVDFRYLPFQ